MTETGVVERVQGGDVVVVFERSPQCGACNACARGGGSMRATVPNVIGAREGQRVTVGIPDGRVLRFSLLVYAVPLAALLLGIAWGSAWRGELWGATVGILQMAAAFTLVRVIDRRIARRGAALRLTGFAE